MSAPLRYVTLPVVGLLLVGLGFGAGLSQAPAVASEASAAMDIDEMLEERQRHMEAMAPMMENMHDMMEMMGAMGRMRGAPGMERMMDGPGASGMERMMQRMGR